MHNRVCPRCGNWHITKCYDIYKRGASIEDLQLAYTSDRLHQCYTTLDDSLQVRTSCLVFSSSFQGIQCTSEKESHERLSLLPTFYLVVKLSIPIAFVNKRFCTVRKILNRLTLSTVLSIARAFYWWCRSEESQQRMLSVREILTSGIEVSRKEPWRWPSRSCQEVYSEKAQSRRHWKIEAQA